jgi:hypothetical protein
VRFFLSSLLLISMAATRPAIATTDFPDSNTSRQEFKSYWGPIPAAADGRRFEPTPQQRALWEWPLELGYGLLRLPFRALTLGAKQTVIFLDESDTFYHLERLMGDVNLPYGLRVGGIADQLSGPGLAVNFYHDALGGEGRRFQLKTQASFEHHQRASLGYVLPLSGGSEVGIGAGYRKRPNARFFGVGPHSAEEDKSFFTQETGWAGIEYAQSLGGDFTADFDLVFSSVSTWGTEESGLRNFDPKSFTTAPPVGVGERSAGIEYSAGLSHDSTNQSARPASGGLRRVQAGWFESPDTGGSHVSLRAELQQFFELWWDRTIALRGVVG